MGNAEFEGALWALCLGAMPDIMREQGITLGATKPALGARAFLCARNGDYVVQGLYGAHGSFLSRLVYLEAIADKMIGSVTVVFGAVDEIFVMEAIV